MTRNKLKSPAGLTLAAILILAAGCIGWLAVRETATQMLSGGPSHVGVLAEGQPDFVLSAAVGSFVANKGIVRSHLVPDIRQAASRLPLDARPYLLIGSNYLAYGRNDQAVRTLEAGRRLDPRERYIHALLLDRYLRMGRFAPAAEEFAVLSRLVSSAQAPIAAVMAQMGVAPQTRDAVRRTLGQNPELERSVLITLASGNVEPSVIFAMASPAALATANAPGSWGRALVDRLVAKRRYRLGRVVWQRINHLTNQQVAPLVYDSKLNILPGAPPFNWSFANGGIGAVDGRNKKIQVDYYGRDSGELVGQLLVLPIGTYRFVQVVSGLQRASGSTLFWSFTCDGSPPVTLGRLDFGRAGPEPRRVGITFTVPANCPAQRLQLIGQAGEFPTSVSATIEHLQLERVRDK